MVVAVVVVVVEVVHSFVVQVNYTFVVLVAVVVAVEDCMVVAVVADNNVVDIVDWCNFVVVEVVRRIVVVGMAVVRFGIGCLGSRYNFVVAVVVVGSIGWEGRCFGVGSLGRGRAGGGIDHRHDLPHRGG